MEGDDDRRGHPRQAADPFRSVFQGVVDDAAAQMGVMRKTHRRPATFDMTEMPPP